MEKWGPAARLIGLGFFVVFCLVGGAFGGLWLDQRFNTQPKLMLTGLVIGLILACWGVYRMIAPFIDNRKQGG